MKYYIKIIFAFCGIVLALGIAGAAFVIAAKPSSNFQLKINYLTEYEFYAERLKADMYRTAAADGIFLASNFQQKILETEQYFSNLKTLLVSSVDAEKETVSAYNGYESANKKLFQSLKMWRQEFETSGDSSAQTFQPVIDQFYSVRKSFENLKTAYQNNFLKQEKKAKTFSIALIISAWGIGVFLTWLLSSLIYSIYIERERLKKAKLRLHLGPKTENEEKQISSTQKYDTTVKLEKSVGIIENIQPVQNSFSPEAHRHIENNAIPPDNSHNADYIKLKEDYTKLKMLSNELETSKTALEKKCAELELSYSQLKEEHIFIGQNREERVEQVKTFLEEVQMTAATAQDDAMVADELVKTFKEGHTLFKTTYEKIVYINQSVSKIREMAEVISEIAEQTKMLSMNAAIEAAHAGEYGKGFAVVAEELGRLAVAALESSSDIGKTVTEVIKNIAFTAQSSESLDKAFDELNIKTNKMYSTVTGFSDNMVSTFQKTDKVLKLL